MRVESCSPRHAIILAAGMGVRLRSIVADIPKGLIELDGEPLVGRSIRLLRDAGIDRITIVAGYKADRYHAFAAGQSDIEIVHNDKYATTGSMASLAVALCQTSEPVLVLESDIVYEARALRILLESPAADATVLSGPTGAGDEVWVFAPDGRLRSMSKDAGELEGVTGEFVGITRLSAAAATAMLHAFTNFVEEHDHARMDYESGGLVAIARLFPIAVVLISNLCWGEIDDERQFERVVRHVWPVVSPRAGIP